MTPFVVVTALVVAATVAALLVETKALVVDATLVVVVVHGANSTYMIINAEARVPSQKPNVFGHVPYALFFQHALSLLVPAVLK